MSDCKRNAGSRERILIGWDEPYEGRYRVNKFGVSKEKLLTSVKSVGDNARDCRGLPEMQEVKAPAIPRPSQARS